MIGGKRLTEGRLIALEGVAAHAQLPAGTALERVIHPKSGVQWCLSIGPMGLPKERFVGDSIDEVLTNAEGYYQITHTYCVLHNTHDCERCQDKGEVR